MSARIISLLPSATEIVYVLGLGDQLLAVTHECDFPPEARGKPHITASAIDTDRLSAGEIDQTVRESLAEQATIYTLDRNLLAALRPDLILTQELCAVCAVGPDLLTAAISSLEAAPQVLSLEPTTLDEVLQSIERVGTSTGVAARARAVIGGLEQRLRQVQAAVAGRPIRRVLTLEWVDPVFVGGHWVPDQVWLAGGCDVLGEAGKPSRQVTWDEVLAAAPDVVVAMPCGFGLERSAQELARAPLPSAWFDLPAVRAGEVYVVDGSSYFNRPGPRLVDGVEILASILHPDAFAQAPPGSYARFPLSEVLRR